MVQHLALYFFSIGLAEDLKRILHTQDDIPQAFFDFANNFEPDDEIIKKIFALIRQLECVEKKGCYLSGLVAKVGSGEDKGDEAFFNALQIDRTVVSWPLHPIWEYLGQIRWRPDDEPLTRTYSPARVPSLDKLCRIFIAMLTSYMAVKGF